MQSQMILTVGLVGAMIIATTAAPAQAQPRRWVGVGMAAAGGVLVALTPTKCRVAGELGEDAFDIVFSNSVGNIAVLFDNPRNPVTERVNSSCDLDWTVDGSLGLFLFGSLVDVDSLGTKSASEFREDHPFVVDSQGTAQAEAYKPKGQLLGGLAIAGAGVVLALLPGGDQVRPMVDFQRRTYGVSRMVSW